MRMALLAVLVALASVGAAEDTPAKQNNLQTYNCAKTYIVTTGYLPFRECPPLLQGEKTTEKTTGRRLQGSRSSTGETTDSCSGDNAPVAEQVEVASGATTCPASLGCTNGCIMASKEAVCPAQGSMVFKCLTSDWTLAACGTSGKDTYKYYTSTEGKTDGQLWIRSTRNGEVHAKELKIACGGTCVARCDVMCGFHNGCDERWSSSPDVIPKCKEFVREQFGCATTHLDGCTKWAEPPSPCPAPVKVNCAVSSWGSCSKTCGGGTQTRTVTTQASNGGTACASLSQSCNTQACPTSSSTTCNDQHWCKHSGTSKCEQGKNGDKDFYKKNCPKKCGVCSRKT